MQAVGRTSACWHEHKAVLALQRSNYRSDFFLTTTGGQPAGRFLLTAEHVEGLAHGDTRRRSLA